MMPTSKQLLNKVTAVAKDVAPVAAAGAAGHAAGKVAQKLGSKIIPGVGTGISVKDAWDRWQAGDRTGAVIATLAAAGWLIPGPGGWVVGGGLDAANLARDVMKDDTMENDSKDGGYKNTRAERIVKQLRQQYPQAQSDFEALLYDYRRNEMQDRRDIIRLDHENDMEEADIAALQRALEILKKQKMAPMSEDEEFDEDKDSWQKHKNPRAGGMSKKAVSSYRRSHPGSKIQTAVTTKPSKLKKGSKSAKRRLSFCRRMRGMKKKLTSPKTARDPNSNINKSLRRWNCESVQDMRNLVALAEHKIRILKMQQLVEGKTPPTAQQRLHQRHQEIRKQRGLPDPDYYKKLGDKLKKEIEDLKKKATDEGIIAGFGSMAEDELDDRIKAQYNTPQMKARGQEIDQAFAKNDSAKLRSMGIIPPDDIERDYQAMRAKEPVQDAALREFAPGDGSGNDRNITWEQLVNFIRRTLDSFGFTYEGSQGFAEYSRGKDSLRLEYDPSDPGWFGWALGQYAGDFNVLYSGTDPLTIGSAENVLEYINTVFGFKPRDLDEDADEIANDKERLAHLQKIFDPDYEYSDDHRVWQKHNAIKNEIYDLKRKIKKAEGGVAEAGPFSYGAKKPRKGSVADLAAKKRKEQEKGKQPVEPQDHMVGVARVKKDVAEGYDAITEKVNLCPQCGGPAYADQVLAEKKDACYSKVKSRYKVWPSAYASGALVRCRKVGANNWGNKSKK